MKVKVQSDKVGFKLNIQKTKIMASSPITSVHIDGETVADFIFLCSKITSDGDCSHEIKKMLTPWKESEMKSLSRVQFFVTPWTAAYQAS